MKKSKLLAIAFMAIFSSSSLFAKDDVTDTYIQNANLASLEGWTITKTDVGNPYAHNTAGDVPVLEFYHTWNGNAGGSIGTTQDFNMSQKVTLPAGNYRLSLYAFYREGNGNGTNTKAYVYAGSEYKKYFTGLTNANVSAYSGGNDLLKAANAFSRGDFENSFDFEVTEDGEIELGFHGYIDTYCSWCVVGGMKLYSYTLDDYLVDYRPLVTKAQGLYNSPMNATVLANLKDAVVDESTFTTIKDIVAAGEALEEAIKVAEASIANYAAVTAKLNTLDAAGKAAFLATEVGQKYANKTYTNEDYSSEIVAAVKAQTSDNADMTLAIVNPSFEDGFTGWTQSNLQTQGNNSFEKTGNTYVERWHQNLALDVNQTITGLPEGKYRVTAHAQVVDAANETGKIYAGDKSVSITSLAAATDYSVEVSVFDGSLKIGASCQLTSGSWFCIDNFRLTRVGAADFEPYTLVEGKMNADVAKAQADADAAFNDNKTKDNYVKVQNAIADAKASKAVYEQIAALNEVVATFDAAGQTAYATTLAAYNAGTLTTFAEAETVAVTAAKAQTTAGSDMTLAILNNGFESGKDNWSTTMDLQGNGEPIQVDAKYLEKWQPNGNYGASQVISLPKGNYSLTVRKKSRGLTSAEVYAGTSSQAMTMSDDVEDVTVEFIVAKAGDVEIGAKCVGTGAGSSWFAIDNFRLTYNGAAPEAINVTAVTLDNSSVSLNSTNNTATFVATVLPADATNKKIKWTSSDENVAKVDKDGVVTGVAPGTATITATSADNEEIKATATVTTSYSETTALPTTKTVEHEDGSKTVYTFSGVNIIKNGSFEYGDPFFGWTNGAGSALAADKFTAADGTITSKASEGSGGAGSVATKWSVDANTTYVFGYRTKANKEGNAQYQKVSLTNDGTETQVVSDDEQIVGTNWTDVQYIFTNAEYSGLQFRARWLANNVAFDDFYLMKVTNIEEIAAPAPVIADLTVNDGVAVAESQDAKNITYVREFKAANKWQSLYLPFSVNLEKNEADVVLAKVDDVVEDNGELVINIVKVSATETVEACKPLFIAAKTVGVKNIKTGVSTVASPNDGGNDYSAAEFTGILSEARAGQAGRYVMSGGELCLVPQSMNNLTLGVNRWAMIVNGGNGVRIRINAEGFNSDEATAIASAVAESVENGEIFSINGAKVKDAKSGLYIKGGKKVLVK